VFGYSFETVKFLINLFFNNISSIFFLLRKKRFKPKKSLKSFNKLTLSILEVPVISIKFMGKNKLLSEYFLFIGMYIVDKNINKKIKKNILFFYLL